jgi:hypothetical protein
MKSNDYRSQYWKEQDSVSLKAKKILSKITDSYKQRKLNGTNSNNNNNNNNTDVNLNSNYGLSLNKDFVWKDNIILLYPSLKELLNEIKLAHFNDEKYTEKVCQIVISCHIVLH